MSYSDFQKYINTYCKKKIDFSKEILPVLKKIVKESLEAVFFKLDPAKKSLCFEIFGYDFLID